MKHIKYYAWIYFGLTIAAITSYQICISPGNKVGDKSVKKTYSHTNGTAKKQTFYVQEESSAKIPVKKQLSPEGLAAQQKYREAKARSVGAAAKLSALYTPEYCAKAADAKMKLRDKHYQKLFDSWELDAKVKSDVIRVLREREVRIVNNAGYYLRGSHNLKDVRKLNSSDKTEDLVAKELLSLHLDASQASEILKLARSLDRDDARLAEGILRAQR